jgi:hypothetical protein
MSKYGAIATEVDGIRFPSKAEARRYQELSLMESGGLIRELELQPAYEFVVNGVKVGTYRADFRYWDNERNVSVVEDVKGGNATKTPVYRLKVKLLKAIYGIDVMEIST